jgi:NitT/TauT family transport system substrate-binding protein
MKKYLIFIFAFTLAVAQGIQVKAYAAEANDYVVKIAYAGSLCHAPLHIAIEKGFFEKEGLKYDATQIDTALIAESAASGQIDASQGLIGKFVQPLENGLPIQITGGIHSGCIKLVTGKDSQIIKTADLKGKKIGVASLADSPALITKRALAAAGIGVTPDNLEAEFIVFPAADLPTALANGAIDAYAASDPAVSIAIKERGLTVLVDTAVDPQFKDEYCCVIFVTDKFAKDHPELAAKYTQAVLNASRWIEENPAEAAAVQKTKPYVAGEVDFNATLLGSYNFSPSVQGGYDALSANVDALREMGILNAGTDKEELVKGSFTFYDVK